MQCHFSKNAQYRAHDSPVMTRYWSMVTSECGLYSTLTTAWVCDEQVRIIPVSRIYTWKIWQLTSRTIHESTIAYSDVKYDSSHTSSIVPNGFKRTKQAWEIDERWLLSGIDPHGGNEYTAIYHIPANIQHTLPHKRFYGSALNLSICCLYINIIRIRSWYRYIIKSTAFCGI